MFVVPMDPLVSSIVKKHAMMGHVIEILVIAQNVISLLINKLNFADQHVSITFYINRLIVFVDNGT